MGALALAGILSGGGKALQGALAKNQEAMINRAENESRQKYEDARHQKGLEAAERLATAQLQATSAEQGANRKQALDFHTIDSAERLTAADVKNTQEQTRATERITADKELQQVKLGGDIVTTSMTNLSNKEIHAASNASAERVAALTAKAHIATATASDSRVLQSELQSQRIQVTGLLEHLSDPVKSDPSNPAVQQSLAVVKGALANIEDTKRTLDAKLGVVPGPPVAAKTTSPTNGLEEISLADWGSYRRMYKDKTEAEIEEGLNRQGKTRPTTIKPSGK